MTPVKPLNRQRCMEVLFYAHVTKPHPEKRRSESCCQDRVLAIDDPQHDRDHLRKQVTWTKSMSRNQSSGEFGLSQSCTSSMCHNGVCSLRLLVESMPKKIEAVISKIGAHTTYLYKCLHIVLSKVFLVRNTTPSLCKVRH